MTTQDKLREIQKSWRVIDMETEKIKRLMPEVEAEISLMGGVGAATGKKTTIDRDIRKIFYKTTKTK